ncbi:MAG: hypothetical protein ACSHX0_14300 [Akkermansiaceae bacterium]
MIARLWRSVKYDDIYVKGYETMTELYHGLKSFFTKYYARNHQGIKTNPEAKYYAVQKQKAA